MTNKLQMRLELYDLAQIQGHIQVGKLRFQYQPMEDCLAQFYITNTENNEFMGSDLTSMMFKRYCSDSEIRQAYVDYDLEEEE